MSNDILLKYQLPESIKCQVTSKEIQFSLPVNLPSQLKDDIRNKAEWKLALIKPKPKANRVYIISGGGSTEVRLNILLYILSEIQDKDGNPLFDPSQLQSFPFPLKYLRYLYPFPGENPTQEDVLAQSTKLHFDVFTNFVPSINDPKQIDQLPLKLTGEQVYVLLSLFGPADKTEDPLLDLRTDENHDRQLFTLNIPAPVNVAIKYVDFDQYEMTFVTDKTVTAQIAHDQIANNALPTISQYQAVFAVYYQTDPVVKAEFLEVLNMENASVVIFPNEEWDQEDSAMTYIEIFVPQKFGDAQPIGEDIINEIRSKCEQYLSKVQLAVCKKCKLWFNPADPAECYRYYHKGKRIPFDSGEFEEVEMDEEEEEPIYYENWSCCGEMPKGETPFECGKESQGDHEVDEKEEKGSIKIFQLRKPFTELPKLD